MASPIPPVPLEGHCSVIYGNILYTYSAKAFQALPLKKGGTWKQLKNGVPVSGATCVKQANGNSTDDHALWVVGGVASGSKSHYPGLQRYSFASRSWETITPVVKVTANRQSHASIFLPRTSQILVYAGSQDDPSTPSIETFTIDTVPPYNVNSYTSKNPPVVAPLLLQWDEGSAITIGGAKDNNQIYLFQTVGSNPWQKIYPPLPSPPKPSTIEQASLVEGTDGSKVLELYDCSTSPVNVSQIVLEKEKGKPAKPGEIPGSDSRQKRKRGINLNNWPNYKAKYAPKNTRSGFSLAQSEAHVIAISGGIKDNHQSVELFNEKANSWIDTSSFFGSKAIHQVPIRHHHKSHHSNPHHTHEPTHSPTADPTPNNDHSDTTAILGAVLGSILGFLALLIVVLLILRRRRQKRRRLAREAQERDEKHRLSFADRGDPFMKEIGSTGFHPHEPQSQLDGTQRQASHHRTDTRGSESSTTHLVPRKDGVQMNDAMEMGPIGEKGGLLVPAMPSVSRQNQNSLLVPGTQQKRTSGWSRYFSGNELGSARNSRTKSGRSSAFGGSEQRKSNADSSIIPSTRDPTASERTQSLHDCSTHGPTQIPPLDMGQQFNEGKVNEVVTGESQVDTRQSTDHPDTRSTRSSMHSSIPPSMTSDTMFSHDIHEESINWTPVTRSEHTLPGLRNTASSSIYGGSFETGEPGPLYQQGPRLSVPGESTTRMVSGASIVGREHTIIEEPVSNPYGLKPIVPQLVPMPARKPQPHQAAVQDDMRWLNLGSKY